MNERQDDMTSSSDYEQPDSASAQPAADWQSLVDNAASQPTASDPVTQLVQEYKEAIKARDEAEDKYLRAAAEFANARRRAELRADNEVRSAKEMILTSFLPVADDLQRALATLPAGGDAAGWLEGFYLIQRKLHGVLDRLGVSPMQTEGQTFDPALHQAVVLADGGDVPSGTVLEELQKGYLLDGKVLRPAMVKVAQ
ncbi:MAG: nucleotide exchange factor GrpE [Caldilineales bacterium]